MKFTREQAERILRVIVTQPLGVNPGIGLARNIKREFDKTTYECLTLDNEYLCDFYYFNLLLDMQEELGFGILLDSSAIEVGLRLLDDVVDCCCEVI